MNARPMKYEPLFGSISYESKDHGSCRLLDYADDWKLASDEEKEQIRLAAAAPELLEACSGLMRIKDLWYPLASDEIHKGEAEALWAAFHKLEAAISKAEGRE